MLKPLTKNEKLDFTLRFQANKLTDELLGELYYTEKYYGLVDIWPEIIAKKGKPLSVEIKYNKVVLPTTPLSHSEATRLQLIEGKGIRTIR